jgi:hypothetical protein
MTSLRQIESNRRNALKSTGPKTETGKQSSSKNAIRHGLTAETVIEPCEDPEDYRAFEQAVTADYDAETAVERELILRLAGLLWRLRRATSIETGLFQIQAEIIREPSRSKQTQPRSQDRTVMALFRRRKPTAGALSDERLNDDRSNGDASQSEVPASPQSPTGSRVADDRLDVARCFSQLADLENDVFDRLGRYEAALWRQVRQTLFALERLHWRAPNARTWRTRDRWSAKDRLTLGDGRSDAR